MVAGSRFQLVFAPEAVKHLDAIAHKHHRVLEQAILQQLSHEPNVETRNRKPLEQPAPFQAAWELRCGPQSIFRVFYEIDASARTVNILAIGVKLRNHLRFGRQEFRP